MEKCVKKNKIKMVKTQTLEYFCNNNKIKKIDLLKMDIEKSELEVLQSSMGFIQKNVKVIMVETHNKDLDVNVSSLLTQIGFTILNKQKGMIYLVRAPEKH